MNDTLLRFLFEQVSVRGELIRLEETYQSIINQHPYPPAIKKVLGEALCAAGLLSAMIKLDGRLTIQFKGKGALKLLLVQCDNHLHLRGLAKYENVLSYHDVIDSFEQGTLAITLDKNNGKSSYQGIVAWKGHSLAESLEGYFRDSEQLATKLIFAVNENKAAGFLLQVIPDQAEQQIGESLNNWSRLKQLTQQLDANALLSMEEQALLIQLYPEDAIRIFKTRPVSFQCTCTRERSANAVLLLGQEEAEDELQEKQVIAVTCDFCNQEYIFDRGDVTAIFNKQNNMPPSAHMH